MTRRVSILPRAALGALLLATAARATGEADGGCTDGAWSDVGSALAGAHGAPVALGTGTLAGGSALTLELSNALAAAPALLVVGGGAANAPFKGGLLVPTPTLLLPTPTDASGAVALGGTWPWGLPEGSEIRAQWWITDAAGPFGWSASNALLGVTPPPPGPGSLPAKWISGVNCATDPAIQVHAYDADTYILRQSQCVNFEGPFMFLFLGSQRALLLDTGAGGIPIAATVQGLVANWAAGRGLPVPPLTVAHTHAHGDHVAGDGQFLGQPNTTVVGKTQAQVAAFFGFTDWPNDARTYDLGGRVLDILAIPGHENSHIAVYDRDTAMLFTGDTLYPGFLFINGALSQGNFTKYKASIARLLAFLADKPLVWIFGNHVEMTSVPFVAYPYGTSVQPDEHVPQLRRQHLQELHDAVQAMGGTPVVQPHADFIIQPSG